MSCVIKGMDAPKSCRECYLVRTLEFDMGRGYEIVCIWTGKIVFTNMNYNGWADKNEIGCPIVELPFNHGPLIDRSKIGLTNFEILMCNGDYKESLIAYIGKVESAEVVIEAEGLPE